MSMNISGGFFSARENRSTNHVAFIAKKDLRKVKDFKPTHVRNRTGYETMRDGMDAFEGVRRSQQVQSARQRDQEWAQRRPAGTGLSGFNLRASLPVIEKTGNQTERGRAIEEQSPRFMQHLPQIESSAGLISHDIGQTWNTGESTSRCLGKSYNTGHFFSSFDRRDHDDQLADAKRTSAKNENQNKLIGRRANILESQSSREEAQLKAPTYQREGPDHIATPISSILNSASGPNTPPEEEVIIESKQLSVKSSRRQSQASNSRTNNDKEEAQMQKTLPQAAEALKDDSARKGAAVEGPATEGATAAINGVELEDGKVSSGLERNITICLDLDSQPHSQQQFKIQPKGLASHKPPIFRTKLTNQFNSGKSNMHQAMSTNLGNMFTNQMMGAFQRNAEYDVQRPNQNQERQVEGLVVNDRTSCTNSLELADDEVQVGVEKGTLQQHFDVQKVFPGKCNVSICYKIRDKRFLLKSISQDIIELQEFANEVNQTSRKKIGQHLFKNFQIDMFDPWINIPPQVPQQNFVTCYGILKVFNAKMGGLTYYTMTELVEDDALTTAQKNLYESKVQQTRQLNQTLSMGLYGRSSSGSQEIRKLQSGITLRVDKGEEEGVTIKQSKALNPTKARRSDDGRRRAKMAKKLTVQELMVQNLVKQQVMESEVDQFESRDDVKAFIYKIAQRSSAQLDAAMVEELADELVADVQRTGKPQMVDHPISTETFYGKREPPESIKVSLNMYNKIKHLALGNLSSLPAIPEHYQRILIGYIIQTSRSLAYAHRHNLVHGNFNLSKVLCQKVAAGCQSDPNMSSKLDMKKQHKKSDYEIHNFYIVNFEPYQVYRYLEQYSKEEKLQKLFAVKKMKLDTASILQMIKIMDIQKFANSIIQIMCGVSDPSVNLVNISGQNEPESDPNAPKQRNSNAQPITGGIQMDLIPLNWQRLPFNRSIMKILSMLFGPYNTQGTIKVNSSQILEEVSEIATNVYALHCLKAEDCNNRCQQERTEKSENPAAHANRLRTVSLNNRAVASFLNITDKSSLYDMYVYHDQIESLLASAIKICPYNQVAHLNLYLFRWRTGAITDDQFQSHIQNNVFKLDKELSRLMFILFKKNIQGGSISDYEIKETVAILEKKNHVISNIASFVFDHPDFLEYKKRRGSRKLHQEKVMYINSTFKNDGIKVNHQIQMNRSFKATNFFFSNNDCYLVAINSTDLIIIDVRTGIKVFIRKFNQNDQLEQTYEDSEKSEQLADSDDEESSPPEDSDAHTHSHSQPPQANTKKKGNQWKTAKHQLEGERVTERKTVSSRFQIGKQKKVSDSKHADPTRGQGGDYGSPNYGYRRMSLQWYELSFKAQDQATAEADQKQVNSRFPPEWLVSVSNSGKIFALYNKSQLIRNKHYKFKKNIAEVLHVYSVSTFSTHIKSNDKSYQVDIQKMLNGNELLSVGVDDVVPMDYNHISVQGKDLHLYIIDFVQNVLIRKIDDVRQSIEMKSIFRDVRRRSANEEYFESLKEYIQQERQKGNEVRLPKINEDIVAVRIKDTNLVQLYHIRLKRVVRQLNVHLDEIKFHAVGLFRKNGAGSESDESILEDNPAPDDLIGQEYAQEQIESRINQYVAVSMSSGLKNQHLTSRYSKSISGREQGHLHNHHNAFGRRQSLWPSQRPSTRDRTANIQHSESSILDVIQEGERRRSSLELASKVDHFEISPQAKVIAAQIGNVIFVKVLNQVNRDQYLNTLEYHHSITFMPLYLDEDYNFKENKSKYKRQKQEETRRKCDVDSSSSESEESESERAEADDPEVCHFELNAETIERAIAVYQTLTVKSASLTIHSRNDKIRELVPFIKHYVRDPIAIYQLNMRPRAKYQRIVACFEIVRSFPTLDKLAISSKGFSSLSKMRMYDQLDFERSFEFVRDFKCSSNPRKTLLAALIFRKLHVYDFIGCRRLFSINLSHPMNPGCANKPCSSLLFIDSDQIIVVQDGQSRIILVSISCQIEAHSRSQVKHKVEDQTLNIKGPNMQQEFDEGFYFGTRMGNHVQDAGAKADEESDNIEDDARGTTTIEIDEVIENMFASRANSPYGYLIILCQDKFYLYYIYEEECQGCEQDLIWSCDYKFERQIRKYGKIQCVDFEDKCESFVSGSNSGYVCCWCISKKQLTHSFRIINPISNRAEPIGLIRNINDGRIVVTYSYQSQSLLITTDQEQHKHIEKPKTAVLQQDGEELGNVTSIKVNATGQFLVVSFQSGALNVYDLVALQLQKHIQPLPRSLIDGVPFHSNIYIDELCSYLAHLGDNKRHFQFYAFDWALSCTQLEKPRYTASLQKSPSATETPKETETPEDTSALARMRSLKSDISSRVCNIF